MKNVYLKSLIVSAATITLMLTFSFIVGCTASEETVDPNARVPDVPASKRGDGGGVPGAAGDVKKKKTSSYIVKQSSAVQS